LVGAIPRRCPCLALALAAPRRGRRPELFRAAPWPALGRSAAPKYRATAAVHSRAAQTGEDRLHPLGGPCRLHAVPPSTSLQQGRRR
jgi:hypothetical protein